MDYGRCRKTHRPHGFLLRRVLVSAERFSDCAMRAGLPSQ
jgi:hypothetical protein